MHRVEPGTEPAPVAATRRLPTLDVLRGFALLGILLMNIEGFAGPLGAALGGIDPTLSGPDLWTDAAIYLVVQGKFYALFSMLFGAGFALLLARAGDAGVWLYLRRLLVLLAIGAAHAFLVWPGDILMVYATLGLVLLALFRSTPAQRLRWWAAAVFVLPIVLVWLFALSVEAARGDPQSAAAMAQALSAQGESAQAMIERQRAAYGPEGSYREAVARNADMMRLVFTGHLPFVGPTILAYFLMGAWLVRSGVVLDPVRHLAVFRTMAGLGWGLGLPLVLLGAWLVPTMDPTRMDLQVAWGTTATLAGNALMALGYLSTIVVAMQSVRWARRLSVLAPAGRMALTTYLVQSLVCTLVFYGYGLGYFEQVPRLWQVPFALGLFSLQVLASHWWLARFRHGPVEWVWRSLTYLRAQPMRR